MGCLAKAVVKAAEKIIAAEKRLERYPLLGKAVEELSAYRDFNVRFGAGGYIFRYRIQKEILYVVHLRHY
ncbi:hypothetical protein FIV31_06935 [Coxiella endosymbiont of Ornithodoros amblus]|uniref:type II toxin-antitoxin system RelE/ParE family toxin n=1 Tax=Coxiella endosymbiont of Ornithodoros amblus TaxID=1656166 RepID=UPI00244E2520|nr:type II toxin-antitoxin system RelE/ParE family toxin [Coxiella endosymbiont of Ornithodoros amblus]MBW5803009.1 hypothetical protein [Coxiella endosymbiont of Ornithodoros amblus]